MKSALRESSNTFWAASAPCSVRVECLSLLVLTNKNERASHATVPTFTFSRCLYSRLFSQRNFKLQVVLNLPVVLPRRLQAEFLAGHHHDLDHLVVVGSQHFHTYVYYLYSSRVSSSTYILFSHVKLKLNFRSCELPFELPVMLISVHFNFSAFTSIPMV